MPLRRGLSGPSPGTMASYRWVHWASMAFFVPFGLLLVGYPAYGDESRSPTEAVGWVLMGLGVLCVPVSTWARFLAPADPGRAVTVHEEGGLVAVDIRLRTVLPAATALLGTVWGALFVWAWVAAGPTGAGMLAVPFIALFASIVPDAVRAVRRRPRLRLSEDGVELRGWGMDAYVDWSDVEAVDVLMASKRRPVVRLLCTTPAPSLHRTWHRLVFHVDPRLEEPVVDIPFLALDDGARVAALLTILRGLPPEERTSQLSGPGSDYVRGAGTALDASPWWRDRD